MNGLMALLRVGQMAEADCLTVAAGIPAIDMMDHAGGAVAREIVQRWTVRPVIVLCGPGNNGGDGFVAARHLLEAGWPVRIALLGTTDQLKGESRHHAARWTGAVELLAPPALDGAALVVDALFGSGLGRKLEGPAADTLAAAAARALTVVAVDVPSGVMGDTGEALGAVAAVLTITFTRKKPGHLLLPGRSLCGEVVVADIGTASSVIDRIEPDAFENDPLLWVAQLPRLESEGNKHTRGHALISGGYPMTGAARMAARAAARVGAGLTTIAVPEAALPIYAAALTSIMVQPLASAADFAGLLSGDRFTAFLIGPGAGVTEETRSRAIAMLETRRPVVLDADALTSFRDVPGSLDQAIVGPA
jgi:hydroxyethylthiazole kinase-like uncharacterized protein yjeF